MSFQRLTTAQLEAERRRRLERGASQYHGIIYHPDDVTVIKDKDGRIVGYAVGGPPKAQQEQATP